MEIGEILHDRIVLLSGFEDPMGLGPPPEPEPQIEVAP